MKDITIKEIMRRNKDIREKYGFIKCPECGTFHTNKTMTCRKCEYKVKVL